MPAVTASPVAASLTANAVAPTAPGKNAAASVDGLPADFASMLMALQKLGSELPVSGATEQSASKGDIGKVLGELARQSKDAPLEEQDKAVDIGGILGQINAQQPVQPGIPALTPAATRHPDTFPHAANDTLPDRMPAGLEVAAAASQKSPASDAPGQLKTESSELPAEFTLPESTSPLPHATGHEKGPAVHAERVKLDVPTPVQAPNWSSDVGQRVVWMAKNNIQEAQLSVNPPHLGPIEISLSLKDDSASARFFSPHAEVREILEQALPRLREMLAGAGVQLGQSDVGAQSQQAFQQFSGRQGGNSAGSPAFADQHPSLQSPDADNPAVAVRVLKGNGLVDTFV